MVSLLGWRQPLGAAKATGVGELVEPIRDNSNPSVPQAEAEAGQDAMDRGAFCVAAELFQDAINNLGRPTDAESSALRNAWSGELHKALDEARKHPGGDDCHYPAETWWKGW
jgi:hypothetical protein